MSKKCFALDIDGTTFDFDRAALKILSEEYPNIVIPTISDKYPLRENFSKNLHPILDYICYNDGFALNMKPFDGVIETIRELINRGHEVDICTTLMSKSRTNVSDKIALITSLIPEVKHIGFWEDKTLCDADILIDDFPGNIIGSQKPSWKRIVYLRPYNINLKIDCLFRFNHWKYFIPLLKHYKII